MQHPISAVIEGKYRYQRLMQQAEAHRLQNQLGRTTRQSRTPILTHLGKHLVTLGEWLQAGETSLTQKPLAH